MIAGLEERVLGEVVAVAALDRLRLAGIERAVVVHLDRIVGEELGPPHGVVPAATASTTRGPPQPGSRPGVSGAACD